MAVAGTTLAVTEVSVGRPRIGVAMNAGSGDAGTISGPLALGLGVAWGCRVASAFGLGTDEISGEALLPDVGDAGAACAVAAGKGVDANPPEPQALASSETAIKEARMSFI